jgi:hypothetical protein
MSYMPVVHRVTDANWTIQETAFDVFMSFVLLTASRTLNLPTSPTTGQRVLVKVDGSLTQNNLSLTINGGGTINIDGVTTYVIQGGLFGPFPRVSLAFDGVSWCVAV